jgi:hypothetical protein
MNPTDAEIIDAVGEINTGIHNRTGNEYLELRFITNGCVQLVEFMGIDLWCSESDERIYDEATDTYEAIDVCLVRLFEELKETIKEL